MKESSFRRALGGLVPYEPGKPVEEVQRELGLERVVKLASNEGPYGPFPTALEALARSAGELNRYPDGGTYRLRAALAERHGVRFEEVAVGSGADGLIDAISQAFLDHGDEVVSGWPSFPSYVIYATKMGAVVHRVPLRDHRYDLDSMLAAITPRTKLAYICLPNNPTGTMNTRAEVDAWFDRVPDHVTTVVDQAYFEYIDRPRLPGCDRGARAAGASRDRAADVLEDLRARRPPGRLRRRARGDRSRPRARRDGPSTSTSAAQEAAVASLGAPELEQELERRRALNAEGLAALERELRAQGFDPVPAVANFLYVEVGEDAEPLFEALLREGVIVRPLRGFGAPGAIRVTVGTPEEVAFFSEALARITSRASVA